MLRSPPIPRASVSQWLAAAPLVAVAMLALPAQVVAVNEGRGAGLSGAAKPALGILDTFGRWDGAITLVYDPDNAPALYSSSAAVLALLEEATGQWERISGVQFVIAGADPNVPDDTSAQNADLDGMVRVSWEAIGGAAGRAGPVLQGYDGDLGYYPYIDGQVELNSDADVWESDDELVGVLVHELGHLLGLGHSEYPDSVMYANPYNHLVYPREDDIRVMQVLYGEGASPVDPGTRLAEWLYDTPPQASAAATQWLFKANFAFSSGAFFELADSESAVTSITNATAGGDFVMLNSGGIGGAGSPALPDNATLIVTDPSGYIYERKPWDISCPANTACQRGASIATTDAIKTMPGTWKAYVVNESNNTTLLTMTLPVTSSVTVNQPPQATVRAEAGSTPATVRFTLAATDAEDDAITVIWHPPGLFDRDGNLIFDDEVREALGSDGIAEQTVDFGLTGEHTFFVELRDDGPRYAGADASSDAGEGYQTLLRLTVELPLTDTQDAFRVVVNSAEDPEFGGSGTTPAAPSPAVLSAVGNAVEMTGIVSTTATPASFVGSSAGFRLGASSDNGVTSATSFTAGASVVIAGTVVPQAADVNGAAEVFIVVRTITAGGETWSMRNTDGNYESWNTLIASLQPAYSSASLPASSAWEIHNGTLVAGEHRIYIGYRAANSTVLHFTSSAMRLQVSN